VSYVLDTEDVMYRLVRSRQSTRRKEGREAAAEDRGDRWRKWFEERSKTIKQLQEDAQAAAQAAAAAAAAAAAEAAPEAEAEPAAAADQPMEGEAEGVDHDGGEVVEEEGAAAVDEAAPADDNNMDVDAPAA
jgi:hypothetical protein